MRFHIKSLYILPFILLLGCDASEENTNAYNADLNGTWIVSSELTKSPCYPEGVGLSFSDTVVLSFIDGDLYADGVFEPGYTYNHGVLSFESYTTDSYTNAYTDTTYTDLFKVTVIFSDNNHGYGTGTSTETEIDTINSFTEVCVETFEYSFTRI